jgi:putative phosphoesterase
LDIINIKSGQIVKIALLSDTHGWIHPKLFEFFQSCDEIWHAGDIGNIETAVSLSSFRPLRAVYGNMDGAAIRRSFKESLRFRIEEREIFMIHIGGTPGHYHPKILKEIQNKPPDIFICGHSHIAKIIFDKKAGFLYINPGAAGRIGFHQIMTAIRFQIDGEDIHHMELIELGERGKVKV